MQPIANEARMSMIRGASHVRRFMGPQIMPGVGFAEVEIGLGQRDGEMNVVDSQRMLTPLVGSGLGSIVLNSDAVMNNPADVSILSLYNGSLSSVSSVASVNPLAPVTTTTWARVAAGRNAQAPVDDRPLYYRGKYLMDMDVVRRVAFKIRVSNNSAMLVGDLLEGQTRPTGIRYHEAVFRGRGSTLAAAIGLQVDGIMRRSAKSANAGQSGAEESIANASSSSSSSSASSGTSGGNGGTSSASGKRRRH